MAKRKIAVILGIRPDVIRASLVLNKLRSNPELDVVFIWSGQHYSDNLKDVFFRELNVDPPEIELHAEGATDAALSASIINKLYPVLEQEMPEAAIFLGDTNTVVGCLAAAQLNIPIVHIEGCMRSYDWRMPEEKYRSMIDHLSDVIYAYFDEYKAQGVAEGLNPGNIVVVQNLIVDVLNEYYFKRKKDYDDIATNSFFASRNIKRGDYYLMTCHRRENILNLNSLNTILQMMAATDRKIFFPAGYRTQRALQENNLRLPGNVIMVDPVGYKEILVLMTNARGVLTDSGTVVEETCVLQVPTVQMRKSTERPQVYDAGSAVKFDPALPERYPFDEIYDKLESLHGKTWEHGLGDGLASQRIVTDIADRVKTGGFQRHLPSHYHLNIERSYKEDDLSVEECS